MNGVNSFSARFPSALLGTLTVLLAFFLGGKLYCSRTGFLSGLVLATNVEFAYLTTRANIDATLTFFTTASLLCFIYWYGDRIRLSPPEGHGVPLTNAKTAPWSPGAPAGQARPRCLAV